MLRRAVLGLVSIGTILALGGPAEAATPRFTYLIDAANDIAKIDHKAGVLSDDDAVVIVKIACDTMSRLLGDPAFQSLIQEYMEKNFVRGRPQARELIGDLALFVGQYHRIEGEELGKAGLEPDAVADAQWITATNRNANGVETVSGERIFQEVKRLQSGTCKLATQNARTYSGVALDLRVAGTAFFGLVVIGVDAAAGLGSEGLLLAVTAASTVLGTETISKAADIVSK